MEYMKEILHCVSLGNTVSNEVSSNSVLAVVYALGAKACAFVESRPSHDIQEIMSENNYSDDFLDDFLGFVRKGFVVFDQACLFDLNKRHQQYKNDKRLQIIRQGSGKKTKELKEFLAKTEDSNNIQQVEENQQYKAERIVTHIKAKKTDYSVILLEFFMKGLLFKPSEKFKQLYRQIGLESRKRISLSEFFHCVMYEIKQYNYLFEKLEYKSMSKMLSNSGEALFENQRAQGVSTQEKISRKGFGPARS